MRDRVKGVLAKQTFDLGDARLEYHHRPGTGPERVVFLHPWFGCWQFWQPTIEALPEFSCYAVDLYSIGQGEWRKYASPEGLSGAVMSYLSAEGFSDFALVGNSLGGVVAQLIASSMPERVSRMVLVGTGATIAGIKPDWMDQMQAWVAGPRDYEQTAQMVGGLVAGEPREFDLYVQAVMNANPDFVAQTTLGALALADLRPRLPLIKATTLCIRGEFDRSRTREHVRDMLAGINESSAIEIPRAGHSPQVDSSDRFIPIIREFLQTGQAAGASRNV